MVSSEVTGRPPPPRPADREGPKRKKAALEFLLASDSVKTNPYLKAFAELPLVKALQEDPRYDGLRRFANIKKEVTEVGSRCSELTRI